MPRRPDLARRSELAVAAFEILRTRGVQTSMRELADGLGVKRPTLYFYFPDLNSIFETVLDQTYQQLAEHVIARTKAADHPIDRLRAMVDATLQFHRDRPQLIGGLLQLWAVGGRDMQALLDRERRVVSAVRDMLVGELRNAIAAKQVKPCDPEHLIDLVLAVVDGVLVHHVLGIARPEGVLQELADRVLEPLRITRKRKR